MKSLIIIISIVVAAVFGYSKCAYRNIEATKANAKQTWDASGYEVVGYEGYQAELLHGGLVWHILHKRPDNGVTYHAALAKWGGEYHIYNLTAIDAIKP